MHFNINNLFLSTTCIIILILNGLLGYRVKRDDIDWNGKNWAMGCDFDGKDFISVQTARKFCAKRCAHYDRCTHYVWNKFKGGTCWMKEGFVTKGDAFPTDDPEMMCGARGFAKSGGSGDQVNCAQGVVIVIQGSIQCQLNDN